MTFGRAGGVRVVLQRTFAFVAIAGIAAEVAIAQASKPGATRMERDLLGEKGL